MAHRIIMPKQGLQMTEGIIVEWLKQEGDVVQEGEPLFEMETDKLSIVIDASVSGTLLKIVREEGDIVPITETIAVIGEPGEDISALLAGTDDSFAEDVQVVEKAAPVVTNVLENTETKVLATPRAKMKAAEKQLSIESIKGTGPDGLIIERDVLAFKTDTAETAVSHQETVIPFSGMRMAICNNMLASLSTMAQANHRMKVDMTESVRLREKLKAAGVKISFTDILVKAVSTALLKYPNINASVDGDRIICRHYVNMGVAVAIDNGLIVPNIKNAHAMSITEIHDAMTALIEKARSGKLTRDEYTGGTFTITNLGMYEVDEFTPVINPPEAGILGIGAIVDTPWVVDGRIEVRPILTLSLTYDHRIIDGAPAAEFLRYIKTLLQNPYLML